MLNWNSDDVMQGIHTISIRKSKNGDFVFYNDGISKMYEKNISDRIISEKYQPIILQCVSKKENKKYD